MKNYMVFDIGGTDIKFGVITSESLFLYKSSIPTKAKDGGLAIIEQVKTIYHKLEKEFPLSGVAISSAGVVNPYTTEVLDATGNINDFIGINIRKEINKSIHCPVSVENDVNCMALCEKNLGVGKNVDNFIAMTIGTGIGGSIIMNSSVFHGNGYSAAEWGRMLIKNKMYEEIASTGALVKKVTKKIPKIADGIEVFKAYDQKNPIVIPLVNNFFDNLTDGLANIIFALNPELIVIGGGITARGEKFLSELKAHLEPKLTPYINSKTTIKLAFHKNDAGMLGAFQHFKTTYL